MCCLCRDCRQGRIIGLGKDGWIDEIGSSDLELVYDKAESGNQTVGIRFQGVQIPKNSTILEAYIQFTVDADPGDKTIA